LFPFLLLPVFHWRSLLILWAPTIGIQLISAAPHQAYLMSHYASAVIAVTPIAAMFGARQLIYLHRAGKLKWRVPTGQTVKIAFIFVILNHVVLCDLPLHRYNEYIDGVKLYNQFGILSVPLNLKHYPAMRDAFTHAQFFQGMTDNLPVGPEHTVTTQNELGCIFLRRAKVYNLPGVDNSDCYIFDQKNYYRFETQDDINGTIRNIVNSGLYTLYHQNGVVIFIKNNLIKP